MAITDRFCPKCGALSDQEGLCNQCRISETRWFSCESRVQNTRCPSCGALKQGNLWSDKDRDRRDIASILARGAVHFHPDVKTPRIDIRIDNVNQYRSHATVKFHGTLYTIPVEGKCDVEIIWQKEQCDRCNRISGSYYEGVVQVRAQDRVPSPYENQAAAGIARTVEEALQTGGERLSFISEINETRDGLDIIVGSQHIGLLISKKITGELGGKFSTHPKLVGERNGKPLYRITYSLRLPRFQKRDVIRFGGHYAEIIQVEQRLLRIFDFFDGKIKSVHEGDVDALIGNARNAEDAIVAYSGGDTIGVIDPVTCLTFECASGSARSLKAGQCVRILRDGDQMVVLG